MPINGVCGARHKQTNKQTNKKQKSTRTQKKKYYLLLFRCILSINMILLEGLIYVLKIIACLEDTVISYCLTPLHS